MTRTPFLVEVIFETKDGEELARVHKRAALCLNDPPASYSHDVTGNYPLVAGYRGDRYSIDIPVKPRAITEGRDKITAHVVVRPSRVVKFSDGKTAAVYGQ